MRCYKMRIIKKVADRLLIGPMRVFGTRHLCSQSLLEASLKLKEIRIFHAEALPSRLSFEHGAVSWWMKICRVIALSAHNDMLGQNSNLNLQEVAARCVRAVCFCRQKITDLHNERKHHFTEVPKWESIQEPTVHTIRYQLGLIMLRLVKGTDVDQTTAFGKSVTVE